VALTLKHPLNRYEDPTLEFSERPIEGRREILW